MHPAFCLAYRQKAPAMGRKKYCVYIFILALLVKLISRILARFHSESHEEVLVPQYGNQRKLDLVRSYLNGTFNPKYEETYSDGCWYSDSNKRKRDLAVIIPFKKRESHLKVLLPWLSYFLQSQRVSYCVFVVEQKDNGRFNKAYLMNAGFDLV